jgi:hypothetical protein
MLYEVFFNKASDVDGNGVRPSLPQFSFVRVKGLLDVRAPERRAPDKIGEIFMKMKIGFCQYKSMNLGFGIEKVYDI